MSILPSIIDIARKHNLIINERTITKKEVLAKCPFCKEDTLNPRKVKKFYLSLNQLDNVFKCWYCKEAGGVIRFISLLEGGTPEKEILDRYRKPRKGNYKPHPVEELSTNQLRKIGYKQKPNWKLAREIDFMRYQEMRKRIWDEWKEYVQGRLRYAYQIMVIHISTNNYEKGVQMVKKLEKEIETPLLDKVLKIYSSSEKPDWAKEAETFVKHVLSAKKNPLKSKFKEELIK